MTAPAAELRRRKSACPSGKEAFSSRYAAERRLFRYQVRKAYALKRAYKCPRCKAWHLTSKP